MVSCAQEVTANSEVATGLRGIMKELSPLDTKSSQARAQTVCIVT